jgi:DnaK suppressor protein
MEHKGGDIADEASDAYERYLLYDLSISEKEELDDINDALRRIDDKTYGICESCEEEIESKRIDAKPYARYCIKCRELKEKEQNKI